MGSHRSDRRGSRRSTEVSTTRARARTPSVEVPQHASDAGKRKASASRHAGSRGPLIRGLPSVPVLAGVAIMAVSIGGALSSGVGSVSLDPVAIGAQARGGLVQASALSGTSKVANNDLLKGRGPTVSRSSSREALADATDSELVEEAERQAKQRNAALAKFAAKAEEQSDKIRRNLWVMPLSSYRLSAGFGEVSYLWSSVHTGLDLSAPSGTPIMAIANGVVTEIGYDGAYGNKTVVTLADGTELWFCHQTSYAVNVGDAVRSGEVIGYVGSTGNTTGPHLHLEVRPGGGDPVDPYAALVAHGLQP